MVMIFVNIQSAARLEVLMALDIIVDLQNMMCSLVDVAIVEEPVGPIFYLVDGASWPLRNFDIIIEAKQHHSQKSDLHAVSRS
jgi:dihydroxyacetone kinase DhaKLM complex PTS-EIIA-like component DhaM